MVLLLAERPVSVKRLKGASASHPSLSSVAFNGSLENSDRDDEDENENEADDDDRDHERMVEDEDEDDERDSAAFEPTPGHHHEPNSTSSMDGIQCKNQSQRIRHGKEKHQLDLTNNYKTEIFQMFNKMNPGNSEENERKSTIQTERSASEC